MRPLTVGAAQLGPIARYETRASVVKRLIALLHQGAERGCDVVVFPELALTTFFPRWFFPDDSPELLSYFETEMPSAETQPLFDEAKRLGIGFHLGYAELTPDGHRYNTARSTFQDTRSTNPNALSSISSAVTSRSPPKDSACGGHSAASWALHCATTGAGPRRTA